MCRVGSLLPPLNAIFFSRGESFPPLLRILGVVLLNLLSTDLCQTRRGSVHESLFSGVFRTPFLLFTLHVHARLQKHERKFSWILGMLKITYNE